MSGRRHFGHARIRAVHWHADGWAVNLWNNFDPRRAGEDFRGMKNAGFNTVILAVPWGEFQPGIVPPSYNEKAFSRLKLAVEIAEACGLHVILRLSFRWDFYPEAESPGNERFLRLFCEEKVYAAWLEYISRLNAAAGNAPNVLFGFISWEDFWCFADLAKAGTEERIRFAQKSGFSRLAGEIPRAHLPGYEVFLDYYDDFFVNRLFIPAAERFRRLSAEVRCDSDPVHFPDGKIRRIDHRKTFALSAGYVCAHYSVSMGGEDGEILQPKKALSLLERNLASLEEHSAGRNLFIDQFIYFDDVINPSASARLSEDGLAEFVSGCGPDIVGRCAGYGLWLFKDYRADAVYNPNFRLGAEGWICEDGVSSSEGKIRLEPGARISQKIDALRTEIAGFANAKEAVLSVLADGELIANGNKIRFFAGTRTEIKIPSRDEYVLTLAACGAAEIEGVSLFAHVQPSFMKGEVLGAFEELNRLPDVPAPEFIGGADVLKLRGVFADGWAGKTVRGMLRVPAGTENLKIRVGTYLPGDWPVEPQILLRIFGREFKFVCRRGANSAGFDVSGLDLFPGEPLSFVLECCEVFSPGKDKRQLSFQLSEIGFPPLKFSVSVNSKPAKPRI